MAKKPRANSAERSVRTAIICIAAVIVVIGAAAIINNRSLSFAATINGQRVPLEHYRFHVNNQFFELNHLLWQLDPTTANDWILEAAWGELVNTTVMIQHAQSLGLTLNAEQDEEARELAASFERQELSNLGFSRRNFVEFARQMSLLEVLYEHLTADIVVSDEEINEAFEEFRETIRQVPDSYNFYEIFVNQIEVESFELATNIFTEIMHTGDLVSQMREHCVIFDPDNLIPSPDGTPIYFVSLFDTNANMEVFELAYGLFEVGAMGGPIQLDNGNFMIFQIVIIDGPDYEELREQFAEHHEMQVRNEYFQAQITFLREQSDVSPNRRALNMFN